MSEKMLLGQLAGVVRVIEKEGGEKQSPLMVINAALAALKEQNPERYAQVFEGDEKNGNKIDPAFIQELVTQGVLTPVEPKGSFSAKFMWEAGLRVVQR